MGSRAVPHRLNTAERKEWDLAKKRRYLLLRGTGWRKERGDSPLANIYRNYCDAVAVPCISMRRGVQSGQLLYDELIIDFSPLRLINVSELAQECITHMKTAQSIIDLEDGSDITKLGWSIPSEAIKEEVIWRLPFYGVSARFSNRKECKSMAETVARLYAGGQVYQDGPSEDEDNMIE